MEKEEKRREKKNNRKKRKSKNKKNKNNREIEKRTEYFLVLSFSLHSFDSMR